MNVALRITAIWALILASSTAGFSNEDAPVIKTVGETVAVKRGSVWCCPVWDGEHIVVSTENKDGVSILKYSESLELVAGPVVVATSRDTSGNQGIADHKHIFLEDHHYIVFSTTDARNAYIVKLTKALDRVKLVPVVEKSAFPSNDMFLVSDGENIYAGFFLPGKGHKVYAFDRDLQQTREPFEIGNGDYRHANGASVIFHEGNFHLLAPKTLDPRSENCIYHIVYDKDWKPIGERRTLIADEERERMVTGVTWIPKKSLFILHYTANPAGARPRANGPIDDSGVIKRRLFDKDWKPVGKAEVVIDAGHRPHTLFHNDTLYLGYDANGGAFIRRYKSQ